MKKLFIRVILPLFLCLFTTSPLLAKEIKTEFGALYLPDDVLVIKYDFEGAYEALEQIRPLPFNRTEHHTLLEKLLEKTGFYQLAASDGHSYYQAFAFAMFLTERSMASSGETIPRFREKDISDLQRVQAELKLLLDLRLIANTQQQKLTVPLKISPRSWQDFSRTSSFLYAYDWPDVEPVRIGGDIGFKTSGFWAGAIFGLLIDINFTAYIYNVTDRGVAVVFLASTSSERAFWEPIFGRVLETSPFTVPVVSQRYN
jgi:hypothetical protein